MFTEKNCTYGQNVRLLLDFMLRSDGGCTLRYTNVVSGQLIRKGGVYGLYPGGAYNSVVLLAVNLSFTQRGFQVEKRVLAAVMITPQPLSSNSFNLFKYLFIQDSIFGGFVHVANIYIHLLIIFVVFVASCTNRMSTDHISSLD